MLDNLSTTSLERWPRWWRMVVVGVSTLILCSCRSDSKPPLPSVDPTASYQPTSTAIAPGPVLADAAPPQPSPPVTDSAIRRVAAQSPEYPPPRPRPSQRPAPVIHQVTAYTQQPLPAKVAPPPARAVYGLPLPPAECLRDGGDRDLKARVSPEWIVHGLEPEDTIGHADTLDGRVIVAPSNCVTIYAPRFAAVRTVVDPHLQGDIAGVGRHEGGVALQPLTDSLGTVDHLQNVELRGDIADRGPQGLRSRAHVGADLSVDHTLTFDTAFLPFENMAIISGGVLENSDKPLLAIGKQAAITWSHDLGVQATIGGTQPISVAGDQRAQATFLFEDKSGPAKLRVIKIASTHVAQRGEIIDFTIRYDNVGDQLIGNVTILDNLTPRLEYVENSAQSDRKADFTAKENEVGSRVLRWDIVDPLPKGKGGIVRFKCRVR